MSRYFIFSGADKERPGSGFIEKEFQNESDSAALELARRHLEGMDYTLWAYTGLNKLGHIQFRFVDYVDRGRKHGAGATSGGAGQPGAEG